MPAPLSCARCRTPLPTDPPDGVCPACGSRLTPDTPPEPTAATRPAEGPAGAATATGTPFDPDRTASAVHHSPAPDLPTHAGLTFLGDGGMGEVFRATHRKTDQVVAVKFLHRRYAGDPAQVARFDTEVKALARARHPHVVSIYEVGEAGGRPYFTMEYLAGGTLAELARRGSVAPREAARLVAAAAGAIASAHGVGVLHRDLKPGNVLLADDGTPKVTDFGLARLADAATRMTISGQLVGTPAYMAPEQADGRPSAVDERTDVYGLGAVLYELLTGRPPCKGETRSSTLRAVRGTKPTSPAVVRPGVPPGLAAICMKCLEKDKALRYSSAQGLNDDLERWLAGDERVGRPAGRLRRGGRWVYRNWPRVTAGTLPLVVLAVAPFAVRPGQRADSPPAVVAVEPRPAPDPWDAVRQELAAGRPVDLLTADGTPRYYDWHLGRTVFSDSPARTCLFQTLTPTLLELVKDPQADRYRLTIELRHVDRVRPPAGDPAAVGGGVVGVYWGYETWAVAPDRRGHRFVAAQFSDFSPSRPRVDVSCHVIGQDANRPFTTPRVELLPPVRFQPTRGAPGAWRQLVVEVRPDRMWAWWRTGEADPVVIGGVLRADKLDRVLSREAVRGADAVLPGLGAGIPPWNPRRPLGIWAAQSVVEVRKVRVEPFRATPDPARTQP